VIVIFFKINSKSIKQPTEITLSFESLDKFERTMDGTMVVDLVGKKEKVEVRWNYLPDADMKLLATEIRSGSFLTIDYASAEQQTIKTIPVRATDFRYMPYYDWAKKRIMWQSVSVAFSER